MQKISDEAKNKTKNETKTEKQRKANKQMSSAENCRTEFINEIRVCNMSAKQRVEGRGKRGRGKREGVTPFRFAFNGLDADSG